MSTLKFAGVTVGAVIALLGVFAITGFVPGLRVACGPGTDCTGQQIVADFSVSSQNLSAKFVDGSGVVSSGTFVKGAELSHLWMSWGDGVSTTLTAGGTLTHLYSSKGNFTVTEKVWATFRENATANDVNTSSFSTVLTVSTSGTGHLSPISKLTPGIIVSQSDQSVSVRDTTVAVNVSGLVVIINWGDQTHTTLSGIGGNASHAYKGAVGTNATFSIMDTVSGVSPNGPISASVTDPVTVFFSNTTPPSPPPPPPVLGQPTLFVNATSLGLLGFGILLAVMVAIPGDWRLRLLTLGVGTGIAVGVGYVVGGFVW